MFLKTVHQKFNSDITLKHTSKPGFRHLFQRLRNDCHDMRLGPALALLLIIKIDPDGLINGGFMKLAFNQKWILSAFLIAALGSQYYYSVSSQQILSSEFASTVPEGVAAAAPAPASTTNQVEVINVEPTPAATGTQAVAAKEECAECQAVLVPRAQVDAVTQFLKSLPQAGAKPAPAAPAPAAPLVAAADDDDSPEAICRTERTDAGKALCLRRERANLQKEQDRDAMELRNQEFEDKMADYADRYSDNLDTLVSRYQSLLRTYSGRKKIDSAVAQRAFSKYIEPLLRRKLNSPSSSPEDVQALHDLILQISGGIPAEYRSVNNLIATDIKNAAQVRTGAVHDTLVEARQAYTDKDYIHSQELRAQAEQNRKQLLAEYNGSAQYGITGYFDMLSNNLSGSDDQSNANLIPSVRALFTTMNNESSNFLNINSSTTTDPNGQVINGGRSGRGTGPAPSVNSPITTQNTGPSLPTVTFGNPATTQQGSRGARR
jgi:hypothetical protein